MWTFSAAAAPSGSMSAIPYSAARHDALIVSLRDGRTTADDVLGQLTQWASTVRQGQARQRIASDAVVVASQAGRYWDAVRWATASDALLGYAQVPLLRAQGAMLHEQGKPIEAMDRHARIIQAEPDNRAAQREVQFLTSQVSAPDAAARVAEADATQQSEPAQPLFSTFERANLRQEALGQKLRWAVAERDQMVGTGAQRYDALVRLQPDFEAERRAAQAAEQAALPADPASAQAWVQVQRKLTYDYWTVLFHLGQFQPIIDEYDALHAQGVTPPYYALSTVAGAHQQLRRSDLAVPLYEAAIDAGGPAMPIPSDTHVGLVYAYLDTARFAQAEALISRLEAATPPLLRLTPEQGLANPQYSDVRHLRALAQLYTEHPAQAEKSFDALVSMAPMNASFRAGEAETALTRQHPDAALALYQEALTDHPDDIELQAGHVDALMATGQWRQAREGAATLRESDHISIAARNAARDQRHARAARLDIEAGAARDGGALANREWQVDTRLTSPLINDQWRIFAHRIQASADIDPERARLARTGLGAQWIQGRWDLSGELHHSDGDVGRRTNGVALTAAWRASDTWRWRAAYDSNSAATPWRARKADINAKEAEVGVGYVVNEARRFDMTYRHMAFSDGNHRQGVGAGWTERWITGPRVQVQTTTSLEHGGNRQTDVPYFSPKHETAAEVVVRGQYLTWKRDDRTFVQAVEAGGGAYKQDGFGNGRLWSLRYMHEWDIGQAVQVSYGIGVSAHPYDGVSEKRRDVFLNLSIPLQ